MDTKQNGTWVDVTGECKGGLENDMALRMKHKEDYFHLNKDGTCYVPWSAQFRWHWTSECNIRIERFVPASKPELKWTAESVAEVDWPAQTEIYTVRCCHEHHHELDEAGVFEERDRSTCAACHKWWKGACPLGQNNHCYGGGLCCGGLYLKYDNNRSPTTARAMTAYIKVVLDRLEAEAAAKLKWEPKVGSYVWYGGESGWRVTQRYHDGERFDIEHRKGIIRVHLTSLAPDTEK